MKQTLLLLAIGLLMAFTFAPTTSNNAPATFSGIVWGNGIALPHAKIVATGKNGTFQTKTDEKGAFQLTLPEGTYLLELSADNYETLRLVDAPGALAEQKFARFDLLPAVTQRQSQTVVWTASRFVTSVRTEGGPTAIMDSIGLEKEYPAPAAAKVDSRGTILTTTPEPTTGAAPGTTAPAVSREMKKRGAAVKAAPAKTAPTTTPPPTTFSDEVSKMEEPTIDEVVVVAYSTPVIKEDRTSPVVAETESAAFDIDKTTDVARPMDLKKRVPAMLIQKPTPAAGVLTAGEWNDLDNWNKHWRDLLTDGEITTYQNTYGLYTNRRYTVLLHNEQGFPCMDVPVTLTDASGTTHWQARTDNTGKAELWYAWDQAAATAPALTATATLDGRTQALGALKPFEQGGANRFTLQRSCQSPKVLDIMWAVDATGSMGDEISYLKTELLDVIKRVQRTNQGLTVRMGAAFYRDNSDAYLVKSSGLSPNIEQTLSYIQEQYADGGGDTPEAVDHALEEVVNRQKWSDEAVARICFLILDASPHHTPESNERIRKCVREAAQKGIRIVPVSASGIEKDTEFLMKFLGLATNGSYVFLTDHSGVGNKHLEPTTDSYKVEAFNDLLVRLINQYASVPTCDGQTLLQFEPLAQNNANNQQQQQQSELPEPARYFPTPVTDVLHVVLPVAATKIAVYDSEGSVVYSAGQTAAGQHDLPVRDLPAGYYALRIWAHGQVQTGKVLVVRM